MREAARTFGLHRDTVRKMLAHSVPPGYRRQIPPRRPKLEPFTGVIDRILEDDLRRPKKQRHTAKRIFERLGDEYGFDGGYTTVKDYVRENRRQTREMFVPLSHAPGQAQCDFGEALVVIGGVERKAHCFVLDLPHSDGCFVKAYPAETTEAFLDGHVSAFAFLGGVPQSILYDNTKLAVAKILGDGRRQRTRAFTELSLQQAWRGKDAADHPSAGLPVGAGGTAAIAGGGAVAQRAGQPFSRETPRCPPGILGHPTLNCRCDTRRATATGSYRGSSVRMWRRILSSRERVTERPRLCAPVAAQWTQRCGRSRSAGTAFRGPSRWIPRRPRTWSAPAGVAAGTGHQAADPARRRPGSAGAVAWSSKPPQPSGSLVTLQSRAATPRSAIAGPQGRAEFCIPGFDPGLPGRAFRYTDRQSIRSLKSRCAANERRWVGLAASKALMAASVSVANWRTWDLGFCAWSA